MFSGVGGVSREKTGKRAALQVADYDVGAFTPNYCVLFVLLE